MGWAIFVLKWLFAYLLGGISFVTLLLGAGWFLIFVYGSKPIGDIDLRKRDRLLLEQSHFKETEQHVEDDDGDNNFHPIIEGWLTVRRQFQSPDQNQQGQMMNNAAPDAVDNINGHHNPSKLSYSTRIAQAYRTVKAAGAANSANQTPKDMFWVQLKGSLLFIYQPKEQFKSQVTVGGGKPKDEHIEPIVALPLNRYRLTMETRHGTAGLTEGKLFSKRTAMVLRLVDSTSSKKEGLHMLAKGMSSSDNAMTFDEEVAPWFIQCKSPVIAEDWYLKLLVKTHDHPTTKRVWSNEHMLWLMRKVQSPDEEAPDSSNLDWLNAFIGRIFLGVTHTALVEQAIIHRINRKLATIQHPLIGPLVATEVNLGHIPPTFSNVKLKDLMGNGTVVFHAHMDYRQPEGLEGKGIRITIEATKLGFKAVLAVVVKSLSSDVQVMIKAPPSDRIWWGFTRPPKMDMVIEPVLGARQINWNFILGFIEKKMREGIAESVVLPNMDDLPFFTTMEMPIRGGIFDSASRGWAEKRKTEEKESVSEDSSSIKSGKSDKSAKSTQTTNTFQTSKTTATSSSHKSDGLRYRNHTLAHVSHDDEGPEKAGIQRAETSPALNAPVPRKQPTSSLKMFGSRPSSVRTESAATTTTAASTSKETVRSASLSEAPKSPSGDSTPASSGFELQPSSTDDSQKSSFTESWKPSTPLAKSSLAQGNASILEKSRASLAKGSTSALEKNLGSLAQGHGRTSIVEACETETPRSLTPTEREELSREIDPSKSADSQPSSEMTTPSMRPAATAAVTTASLITAVRARDKAGLQSQAVVAKEGLKKWGVNFINKRRAGTQHDDDDEHAHVHTHAPAPAPGYYAPSTEEREHSHQPRTSLQERLNAAAQAKRDSAGSPGCASLPQRPSTTSPDPYSSPAPASSRTETPVKGALNAIPAPTKGALNTVAVKSGSSIARPLPRPAKTEAEPLGSHTPNISTSPPTFSPPPAARMVVPSVPKRAGVVTSIGHNPSPVPSVNSKSVDALDQASASSKTRSASNASASSGMESWIESGKAALAGLKSELPARAESAPVPATEPAPTAVTDVMLDKEASGAKEYYAHTPVPSVTATSVTTRTAAADGASPARESLLGHVRSASGNLGGGNATTGNTVSNSSRNDSAPGNSAEEAR